MNNFLALMYKECAGIKRDLIKLLIYLPLVFLPAITFIIGGPGIIEVSEQFKLSYMVAIVLLGISSQLSLNTITNELKNSTLDILFINKVKKLTLIISKLVLPIIFGIIYAVISYVLFLVCMKLNFIKCFDWSLNIQIMLIFILISIFVCILTILMSFLIKDERFVPFAILLGLIVIASVFYFIVKYFIIFSYLYLILYLILNIIIFTIVTSNVMSNYKHFL